MNNDELDKMTDAELNEAFAVEVAGWTFKTFPKGACPDVKHWATAEGEPTSIYQKGNYCADANAVLPFLLKCRNWRTESFGSQEIWTTVDAPEYGDAVAPTFGRSATLALLRAKRAAK